MISKAKEILIEETQNLIQQAKNEIELLSLPNAYNLIIKSAEETLDKLKEQYVKPVKEKIDNFEGMTKQDIKNYLKSYPAIRDAMKVANNPIQSAKETSAYQSTKNTAKEINEIINQLTLSIIYIIDYIKDLITESKFPSINKAEYIRKFIDTLNKKFEEIVKKSGVRNLKDIFKSLSIIDGVVIAITAGAALYLANRDRSQKGAEEVFFKNACPSINKEDILGTTGDNIVPTALNTFNFNTISINDITCPLPDNNIVPQEPYSNKVDNFSCEIPLVEENQFDGISSVYKINTATKAIIKNLRDTDFDINVKIGDNVNNRTVLGTIEGHSVYSPVNGRIFSLESNSISLEGISEPIDNKLATDVSTLNAKYEELNYTKLFIKDWQIESFYPVMLFNAPNADGSLNAADVLAILNRNDIDRIFDKSLDKWDDFKEDHQKRVQKITGKDNVKINAENNTLINIKNDIDKEEATLFAYIDKNLTDAIANSKTTKARNDEFILIEYYLNLHRKLKKVEKPTNIEKDFASKLLDIVTKRYLIDGWKTENIKEKFNVFVDKLDKRSTILDKILNTNWFEKAIEQYKRKKKKEDVKTWLELKGEENKKLKDNEKEDLIERCYYLFEFYISIKTAIEKYKDTKTWDKIKELQKEKSFLSEYFKNLHKRLIEIHIEIKSIEASIDDTFILANYFIQDIKNEEYRVYNINKLKPECVSNFSDPDDKNTTDLGSIKYWLKWMAFATLASVTNFAQGWSTGLILPSGPLKLPTVYIPIKAITTGYGNMVIGLTITGIWVFPFIMFNNISSENALPIIDPVATIKKQIQGVREELSAQIKTLKTNTLKKYLEIVKKDLNEQEIVVEGYKISMATLKSEKPPRTKQNAVKYADWTIKYSELYTLQEEAKVVKWKLQTKYNIINKSYIKGGEVLGGDPTDVIMANIKKVEDGINKGLDKLVSLVDKINEILSPLPITLKPFTLSFAFSLKNPKPLIEITKDIDDNVHQGALDKIVDKFKLKSDMFMKKTSEKTAIFEYDDYRNTLDNIVTRIALIKAEPFPIYENLNPIKSVAWAKFLYSDFAPTGAKTFGIPGQLPLPV